MKERTSSRVRMGAECAGHGRPGFAGLCHCDSGYYGLNCDEVRLGICNLHSASTSAAVSKVRSRKPG